MFHAFGKQIREERLILRNELDFSIFDGILCRGEGRIYTLLRARKWGDVIVFAENDKQLSLINNSEQK